MKKIIFLSSLVVATMFAAEVKPYVGLNLGVISSQLEASATLNGSPLVEAEDRSSEFAIMLGINFSF